MESSRKLNLKQRPRGANTKIQNDVIRERGLGHVTYF